MTSEGGGHEGPSRIEVRSHRRPHDRAADAACHGRFPPFHSAVFLERLRGWADPLTERTMYKNILRSLGIEELNRGGFAGTWTGSGPALDVFTPIDGSKLATVQQVTEAEYDAIAARAHEAFLEWR